jgi:hypothetical protein
LNTDSLRRHPWAIAGQALVWLDLLVIPWLLWPLVRGEEQLGWDQVIVPALLLIVLVALQVGEALAERQPRTSESGRESNRASTKENG